MSVASELIHGIWIDLTDQIKLWTFKWPTKKFSKWWYFSLPLFSVFGFKARPVSMYVVSSRHSSLTETMLEWGAEEVLVLALPPRNLGGQKREQKEKQII